MKNISAFCMILLILAVSVICFSETSVSQRIKDVENFFTVPAGKTLEANIYASIGELFIKKSREDYNGMVTALYDTDKFNYDYFFDEDYNELYVTLKKGRFFEEINSEKCEMEVFLPRKVPTNLDIEVKAGVIDVDLTDVYLCNFELNSWAGETTIRFGEPNPVVLKYLKVDVNIGEVRIEGLGNANFSDGFIDGGIGELVVDLSGKYSKGDHHLKIDLDIGSTEITLPRNVGIRMSVSKPPLIGHLSMEARLRKRGKYYYSRNFEEAETKLFLRIETGIGECIVR